MKNVRFRRFDDPALSAGRAAGGDRADAPVRSAASHDFARQTDVPLLRPNPGRLSEHVDALERIEASGIFSNYGPVNTELEQRFIDTLFQGRGSCVTVCNATIGLMMAMRAAIGPRPDPRRRYALMPSFTFAATAHAAQWVGLTPLLCDIDPRNWTACVADETRLLERFAGEIAVLVPCTTFGNPIELSRYDRISEQTGIPIVIDAAAALGSLDQMGRQFGTDTQHSVVFSMHATKTFAAAEGGLVYCGRQEVTDHLRVMGNFGFGSPRTATMPGLNSKMSEVTALLALLKLNEFEAVVRHRDEMMLLYRDLLPGLQFQEIAGRRQSVHFVPIVLPEPLTALRGAIVAELKLHGIGTGTYFSPHVAQQSWFAETASFDGLPVSDALAAGVLALPMSDIITGEQVMRVCDTLRHVLAACAEGLDPATTIGRLSGMERAS